MDAKRVVITGVGLVTPLGASREKTWAAVRAGQSAIGRLDEPGFQDLEVRIGGRCTEVADFPDANDDRVVTLGLIAAREAWYDAGLKLYERDGHRVGCAIGCSKGGLSYLLAQHRRLLDRQQVSPLVIPAFAPSACNASVAMALGLCGPFANSIGACATGLLCVIEGLNWVRAGRCEAALVGSTDASVLPLILGGFNQLGVLSHETADPHQACKPFDARRDGFAVSEGASVIVLEPLDAARRRKARIYGEITGWAAGALAYEILALPKDGAAVAQVVKQALDRARVRPAEVDFISAHGTGTLLNDRVETDAVKRAFRSGARDVCISATKSMLGHLLGACASVELAVALLAMRDGFVPPTINLHTPDPLCDLDYVPNQGRPRRIRNLLKISIGFGGHVAALVVSRPPE